MAEYQVGQIYERLKESDLYILAEFFKMLGNLSVFVSCFFYWNRVRMSVIWRSSLGLRSLRYRIVRLAGISAAIGLGLRSLRYRVS